MAQLTPTESLRKTFSDAATRNVDPGSSLFSLTDPTKNIFAFGGNTIDAQTGAKTPVIPVIDSYSLRPTYPIPFLKSNPSVIPDVKGLDIPTFTPQETPQETKAFSLNDRIKSLNDKLIGKSEFQTQQENLAGIPALEQTQTDLATQLNQLKNEALAIPQQLQVEATGRGITTGGLAPLQTARLRTNAIQALGVSSLLDASRGLLASAQAKADRAVSAKYDPIQEQIDIAMKNLNLILNDPRTTFQEKNRATKQLAIQNEKKRQFEIEKQNTKDINAVALEAAKNGADAVTLQNISKSKNLNEAIINAGGFIAKEKAKEKLSTSVQKLNGKVVLINNQTGETIKVLGEAPKNLTEQLKSDIKDMSDQLDMVKGPDGFISPDDWKIALDVWIKEGGSKSSFIKAFKEKFTNPNNPNYEGIKRNLFQ